MSTLKLMVTRVGRMRALQQRSVLVSKSKLYNRQYSSKATTVLSNAVRTAAAVVVTVAAVSTTAAAATIGCDAKDVLGIEPHQETSTGIWFPHLCNGMTFTGCGVRVKYGFVKVYAVATYLDPTAMHGVKHDPVKVQEALIDPTYPRTIRIVMNRGLSIDKYTSAIVEALEPRMKGRDPESLIAFTKLNPKVDLVQGAVMEMTIRGDTLLYKNSVGGIGQITSRAFCEALCHVYYGTDPVSPGHAEHVRNSVSKL